MSTLDETRDCLVIPGRSIIFYHFCCKTVKVLLNVDLLCVENPLGLNFTSPEVSPESTPNKGSL